MTRERTERRASIDTLRGAVMVLMALDHVRDYVAALRFAPENLSKASAALFATRWVTHICAPTFFLLAGLGIALSLGRGRSKAELSRFLVTRGLWLVVLELTITAVAWQFAFHLLPAFAIVIWALGWSMVIMALLIHLPNAVIVAIALMTIGGHNLLDGITPASLGAFAPLWHVLHVPGFAIPNILLVAYPIIPWFAVMALGYSLGKVYEWEEARRRRFLLVAGLGATIAFVLLRAWNGYGNPQPWSAQRSTALTVASFLNVLKYPPSLDFLLMTLGPALVALALLEKARGPVTEWLSVYGRVPMFYYVVHIVLIHAMAVCLAFMQGGTLRRIPVVHNPELIPAWYGVNLPGVYVAWVLAVVIMYWPCRWFAQVKATRKDWWLSYL